MANPIKGISLGIKPAARPTAGTNRAMRKVSGPTASPKRAPISGKASVSGPSKSARRAPIAGKAPAGSKAPAPSRMGNASMIRSTTKTAIRGGRSAAQGQGDAKAFARANAPKATGAVRGRSSLVMKSRPANPLPPMSQRGGRGGLGQVVRGNGAGRGNGLNPGKFIGEVAANAGRGAARVGQALDSALPGRVTDGISNAMHIPDSQNPLKRYGR